MKKEEIKKIHENFFAEVNLKDLIGSFNFDSGNKYSLFNNLFLIAQAKKQEINYVGVVKPFSKWKSEKTTIKKGSRALRVYCPTFFKVKDDSLEEGEREVLRGFIQRPVFDISQTNNVKFLEYQKKKEEVVYKNELGLSYDSVKKWVVSQFEKQTFREELKECETKGYFVPKTNEIVLHVQDPQTLLHEYSHSIMEKHKELYKNDYAYNEVVAEITAHLISKKLGSKGYNFNYSNIWAKRIELKDFKVFVKVISVIEREINKLNFKGLSE